MFSVIPFGIVCGAIGIELGFSPILVYALYIFPAMYSIIGAGFVNASGHYPEEAKNKTWVTLLFFDGHHKYHHENPSEWYIPFPYLWINTFIRLIKSNQH